MPADTQNALAGLRRWTLERDASGPNRVYRDQEGNTYASVTHILKETSPQWQKDALDRWTKKPGAAVERDVACQRGTLAHDHAEYVLKTAAKLARQTANKRNSWRSGDDGLERAPKQITSWAIGKAIQGAPRVPWSASGYARGLRSWIGANVTAIHAIEFSVFDPRGWAGTADALIDVDGTLCIADWKTSVNARSEEMLANYICQAGAYSLGLQHLTGIKPKTGAVVVARRSGAPQVRLLNELELRGAECQWLERMSLYKAQELLES